MVNEIVVVTANGHLKKQRAVFPLHTSGQNLLNGLESLYHARQEHSKKPGHAGALLNNHIHTYMSKALKLSLVAASVVLAFSASAQNSPAKPKLPDALVQAVRKAVASNPEVQAKWNAFMAADSQRDIAKAGFLPQIDLSASVGNESRTSGGVSLGSYDLSSAQLSLNQILFDGFFTRNEVKRLSAAKLTRYYELLEVSESTALEATKAYADVARYRELVDLATQNYVEHKQSANLVEERANSGVGRRVDVEQANGRLALSAPPRNRL